MSPMYHVLLLATSLFSLAELTIGAPQFVTLQTNAAHLGNNELRLAGYTSQPANTLYTIPQSGIQGGSVVPVAYVSQAVGGTQTSSVPVQPTIYVQSTGVHAANTHSDQYTPTYVIQSGLPTHYNSYTSNPPAYVQLGNVGTSQSYVLGSTQLPGQQNIHFTSSVPQTFSTVSQNVADRTLFETAKHNVQQSAAQRVTDDTATQQVHETQRAAEEASRKAQEAAAEEAARRQAEEAQRVAEESARRAQEVEAQRAAVESAKRAQEAAEESARRAQEAAAESARRVEEAAAQRAAEDSARRAQEAAAQIASEEAAKRTQELLVQRVADEAVRRTQEVLAHRAAEEDARRAQEAAALRAAEDARRAQEAAALRAAEDARRAQEAAALRAAEDARRAQEAAALRAAEDARLAQEAAALRAAEESTRRAQEAAEHRAAAEALTRTQEAVAQRATYEAARQAQEDAAQRAAYESARQAQEVAAQRAAYESARRAQEVAAQRTAEEAARRAQESIAFKAAQEAAALKAWQEVNSQQVSSYDRHQLNVPAANKYSDNHYGSSGYKIDSSVSNRFGENIGNNIQGPSSGAGGVYISGYKNYGYGPNYSSGGYQVHTGSESTGFQNSAAKAYTLRYSQEQGYDGSFRYDGSPQASCTIREGEPNLCAEILLRLLLDPHEDPRHTSITFETDNGINVFAEGGLKNPGTDYEAQVIRGSYSYVTPDGQRHTVHYLADENGYHAHNEHFPLSKRALPQAIVEAIAQDVQKQINK